MSVYCPLFEHMQNEHGLTLTDSEMHEICRISQKISVADSITIVSSEADFEKNTWTFSMPENTRVGAGAYALIKI